MVQLSFPVYSFKTINTSGETKIFDRTRKKYVALTPEEWVRQHLIEYLVNEKGFPRNLLHVEAGLKLHTLRKRADLLAYNRQKIPLLLAECKAPSVVINQAVFDQIAMYNMVFHVPYLLLSNGLEHYCCRLNHEKKNYHFLPEIPSYSELG